MNYISILIPLITIVIAMVIIIELGTFRFSKTKLKLIITFSSITQILVSGIVLVFFGIEFYSKWYVVLIVIPTFVTFIYTSSFRDFRDIFTIVTTTFISIVISIPSIWLARYFNNSYIYYNIFRIIIFILVMPIGRKYLLQNYLLLQKEIQKGWLIFSIIPIVGSIVIYYSFYIFNGKENFMEILYIISISLLVMTIFYIVIFYMFMQLHEKYLIQEQQKILAIQNKAQLDQFISFKESSDESNRRWHDYSHNTEQLIDFLESDEVDDALDYLKKLRKSDVKAIENFCEHTGVNSILVLWNERSLKEDIKMEIKCIIPKELKIDPMELSALFSNAIENAYNACILIPESESRFISVKANYNGKRLAIGIENSCSANINFHNKIPVSKKKGGGIGTRSIIYTIKRFHGAYTFKVKDGVFLARFILNI